MYDPSDPRAALAPAHAAQPTEFAAAQYVKFYESDPQEIGPEGPTWLARGQNFAVAYTEAQPNARIRRSEQCDEYVVLIPDAKTIVEISTPSGSEQIRGNSLVIVPPGESTVHVTTGGRIVRLFTTRSADLAARCSNAASYRTPHPNVAAFAPWPEPVGGYRIRSYSLDVPSQEGRFGRIFRCTTLMVNYLEPHYGPRDPTRVSPHHHDDFEQCSLALEGDFTHHLRWPWTTNMNAWRADEHVQCASPSVAVIPPPAIHTSRWTAPGINQLVDIFCPPRIDFSKKPGWVLNADDYPMPSAA